MLLSNSRTSSAFKYEGQSCYWQTQPEFVDVKHRLSRKFIVIDVVSIAVHSHLQTVSNKQTMGR